MRKLMWGMLFLLISATQAYAQSPSLIDYVRTAPATVAGHLIFEAPHKIYRSPTKPVALVTSGIRPQKTINFAFDENAIALDSKNALYVSIAGVPVNITNMMYDNRTGQMTVKTSVMGTGLQAKFLEKKIRSEVLKQFGPKLKTAFENLAQLRKQRTIGDASNVLREIVHTFDGEGNGKPNNLPSFHGELTLINSIENDQTVSLGKLSADLKKGDALESTVEFSKPKNSRMQIKGITLLSLRGVRVRQPKTDEDSIKTVTLKSVSLTEARGFQMEATNGGDDLINGTQLIVGLIQAANRGNGTMPDCDPSQVVQNVINTKTKTELLRFTRTHREAMLQAGATPELLRALEREDQS